MAKEFEAGNVVIATNDNNWKGIIVNMTITDGESYAIVYNGIEAREYPLKDLELVKEQCGEPAFKEEINHPARYS